MAFYAHKILASLASLATAGRMPLVRVSAVRGSVTLAATDGRGATVVRLPVEVPWSGSYLFLAKDALAAGKFAGSKGFVSFDLPGTIEAHSSLGCTNPLRVNCDASTVFPPMDRVIPAAYSGHGNGHFDADLLAQFLAIHATACNGQGKRDVPQVQIDLGEALNPCRIASRSRDGAEALSVVMPMRSTVDASDVYASVMAAFTGQLSEAAE